ncbi:MAG TPA: hypothetical protein VFW87_09510 [Pirellulales bacterium]|nr:hypothetical protein [Pirellulales bacterium]
MSFQETVVNPGAGGAKLASDTFTQGADTVTLVYSGIAFGSLGGGTYQPVDPTHGLPVNVIGGTLAVSGIFWQATQPVSLAALPPLAAGSNLVGQVEVSDGTNVLGTTSHPVRIDPTGNTTQPVSIAGSVAVSGTFWQATQPVSLAALPPLAAGANNAGYITPAPAGGTAGAAPFHLGGSAASTNAASVTTSPTTLWDIIAMNVSASSPAYLKLYDKASVPVVGTDSPVYVLPLPTAGSTGGAGAARSWPTGLRFSSGLAYAITLGMADSDATAVAANQVVLSGTHG